MDAPAHRIGPSGAHGVLGRMTDESLRPSDALHHVVARVGAGRTRHAFELDAVADVDANRTDRDALSAVDAVAGVRVPRSTHHPPAWLPAPRLLVWISGVCEIVLGALVLVPRARKLAGYGLVALYLAVFPANVNMVLHPELGGTVPLWALWVRLPLQLVIILLAARLTEIFPFAPRTAKVPAS